MVTQALRPLPHRCSVLQVPSSSRANSMDTADHISKALGKMTTLSHSKSHSSGKGKDNDSETETGRFLMEAYENQRLKNDRQIVMVRAMDPMKLSKFKLEDHPNFKKSADYDKKKRLAIKKCYDLKKKIAELEVSADLKDDDQTEINKKAQRTVGDWMGGSIKDAKSPSKNNNMDEFLF